MGNVMVKGQGKSNGQLRVRFGFGLQGFGSGFGWVQGLG